jgi:hypothetical protein
MLYEIATKKRVMQLNNKETSYKTILLYNRRRKFNPISSEKTKPTMWMWSYKIQFGWQNCSIR